MCFCFSLGNSVINVQLNNNISSYCLNVWRGIFLCHALWCRVLDIPSSVWYVAGLDTDGIYRVSGNLAVIQKLRFLVNHGKDAGQEGKGCNGALWRRTNCWRIEVVTNHLALSRLFSQDKCHLLLFCSFWLHMINLQPQHTHLHCVPA